MQVTLLMTHTRAAAGLVASATPFSLIKVLSFLSVRQCNAFGELPMLPISANIDDAQNAGRIAVYFTNNGTATVTKGFVGNYYTRGGQTKSQPAGAAGVGGPGTVFLYDHTHIHRSLIVGNDDVHPTNVRIGNYADLSHDSGRAWIMPESASHPFAHKGDNDHHFHFEELQMWGGAHLAIATDPPHREVDVFFKYMIGDRTGQSRAFC